MGVPVRRLQVLLFGSVASLVVGGLASIGMVHGAEDRARQVVVVAAGQGVETVGLPTTTIAPPPVVAAPVTPPPTPPAPPVTRAPAATTTTAPPRPPATTAAASTTATPARGPAMVTLVNQHPMEVSVLLNGEPYRLGVGQAVGPVPVTPAPSGNDIVELELVADPTCGTGDAHGLFTAGRAYRFTVVASTGQCGAGYGGPDYRVTPA